jgi:ATP-dependent helicase HrpA
MAGMDLASLKAALAELQTRDRGRLLGQWRRLSAEFPDPRKVEPARIATLAAEIERSVARTRARQARVPSPTGDAGLPIDARADQIVSLIRAHQVLVLAGETGSGKSTQLPKLCLAAGRGATGLIGCTQPRRIAARSVARRVADELGSELGDLVGFQVRFAERVGADTLVKFMTDGILLAETRSDPWLAAYDTIILDEAHERSLNIDFLLGYLKRLLAKRRDLKLVVTSATIDTAKFAAHFGDVPVLEIEGRGYPVEVRWRPAPDKGDTPLAEQVALALDEITREDPRGDVLAFFPGEREIRDAHLALSRRRYRETEVLPLYARLSAADQDRVFRPGPQRRIVLATNVAETSLTVPRIRYVVDTGTARVKRYSQRGQLDRLRIEPVSRAAADQRKGRCGRTAPGICYRLYSEDDYAGRPRYTDPEILRSSLAGVILRMLDLQLGEVADFPFVDAPPERMVADGYRRLVEIGAIAEHAAAPVRPGRCARRRAPTTRWRLTPAGESIARMPVDVALGRMLVEARTRGVLRELLVLVAFLSVQDPRERPADARQQADAAHAAFAQTRSDFLGVLNLWAAFRQAHEELTQSKLRDWCRARFLSYLRLREWRELHRQLLLVVAELGWDIAEPVAPRAARSSAADARPRRALRSATARRDSGGCGHATANREPEAGDAADDARYEAIHRCLLSGWPTQVGQREERNAYHGTRERRFAIFPGSALAKSPPRWLLAGVMVDIGKVWAMQCARVEPAWIEQQAAHLVKRSWHEPHWSRQRGAVLAFEQVSLFGLVLVARRSVAFGRQDPALAHTVFVRDALARCDLDARAAFVRSNAKVLDEARAIEAKQRRADLLRPADELAAFFAGKLPGDISTTAALDAWYRNASPAEQAALHWSLGDVLAEVLGLRAADFPAHEEVAGQRLRLEYRFVPGDPADGVSLHVPLALLNAVSPQRCAWLVPGLLAEKLVEWIRGLPKPLRRNFVPAPDFARAFLDAHAPLAQQYSGSLPATFAAWLAKVTGVAVDAADLAALALPEHLRMRIVVHDESGKQIADGRDVAALQAQWQGAARAAFSRRTGSELQRDEVATFDFDEIPESVVSEAGLPAFPALVDLGESVALRVFERADEAQAAHRRGVERLLRRALEPEVKRARRQLPVSNETALRWLPLGSVADLRADLVEAALRDALATHDTGVRQRDAFDRLRADIARGLYPAALARLEVAERIVAEHAALAPWLEPPLLGFATANYDDLREQLGELLAPGFLRATDAARLAHFPRYLRAMRLRAERLRQDPARDQSRLLAIQRHWHDYLRLRARGDAEPRALDTLRWLIEELRVSVFAQELRTAEPVSPKRLARAVADAESGQGPG